MMRVFLIILGIIAFLIGLLWVGQGTGIVPWPTSSVMVGQYRWSIYGAFLSVFGIGVFLRGLLRRRR